jgi:hypothetical protein
VTITDLSVGRHTVELKSPAGNVERTVTVAADKTAEMEESIFSGWVAVYSPFDLTVTEGGRALLMDDRHQVMLSPGRHVLRLVNRTLAYDAVRQVDLKPGEVSNLTVSPPPSSMTVTASEAAEVWVDGVRSARRRSMPCRSRSARTKSSSARRRRRAEIHGHRHREPVHPERRLLQALVRHLLLAHVRMQRGWHDVVRLAAAFGLAGGELRLLSRAFVRVLIE